MRLHITMLYGIGHTSAAAIAMKNVVNIAKQMGANELGLYKYPVSSDSDRDLNVRMDGILASIWHGDVVILQHPSWNDLRYEEAFVRKVKNYSGTKLIIFIHDIIPLMMNLEEERLEECIALYNKADLLILPSKNMHDSLIKKGLLVEKVIYQEVWDYPIEFHEIPAVFERKLHFLGSAERFPFIKEWNGKSTIELYGNEKYSDDPRFVFNEQMKSDLLVHKISQRGFGLVWAGDDQIDYSELNQPFKLGTYLAACVPVIIQRGMAAADFVERNGVGFVVDALEEADEIVQNISEEEYWKIYERVKNVQFLVSEGYYTRKLLNEAVLKLFEEK